MMQSIRKFFRNNLITISMILIIFSGIWIEKIQFINHVQNTASLKTMESFIKNEVTHQRICTFINNEKIYVFWIGEFSFFRCFYSEPPCYIFDKDGLLVDFSVDYGSDSSFSKKWNWHNEQIEFQSPQEVLQILQHTN